MTTDITELAQRMKAAAMRAKAATEDYVAHRMSITVFLEECKEFNDLSDGPDNIIALAEALEKAQQRIAELEDAEQKLCAANVTLDARAELAERQLAELESRTVTVKPMRPGHITVGGEKIGIYMRDEVDEFIAALTAAGIKWEAE